MKWKRSERLVDMTSYLQGRPRELVPLNYFAERYGAAKSSVSEDLGIIKETLEASGSGRLATVAGATGGVRFTPLASEAEARALIRELLAALGDASRLLPGGYLYMTDLLGTPSLVDRIGRVIATAYADRQIDVIMTVATKGIPIAHSIARHLNVPVVVVRKDSKVTEGPTVSINYISGSLRRIETMVLSKRSMESGRRVLLTDDFMKGGGTMVGMANLLKEFDCELAGVAVLVEAAHSGEQRIEEYISLLRLGEVNERDRTIALQEGNYFTRGGHRI